MPGRRVEGPHDGLGIAQIGDGFEQGRHDQFDPRRLRRHRTAAVEQAELLLEHEHFQKIADRLGMADDVVADRLRTEGAAQHSRL